MFKHDLAVFDYFAQCNVGLFEQVQVNSEMIKIYLVKCGDKESSSPLTFKLPIRIFQQEIMGIEAHYLCLSMHIIPYPNIAKARHIMILLIENIFY